MQTCPSDPFPPETDDVPLMNLSPELEMLPVPDEEPDPELKLLLARKLSVEDRLDSLVAHIALNVGAQIVEGHLLPGTDLNSVDLAAQFGSSRTPVREALLLLEKQGLVDVPARRRPVVSSQLDAPVDKIYEARALLSGYLATAICRHWHGDDLEGLWNTLEEMRAAHDAGDPNRYFWAMMRFGEEATAAAGNPIVSGFVDAMSLTSLAVRRRSMGGGRRMEESLRDHLRLYQAFVSRDALLARALAMSIIRDAYFALVGDDTANWPFD